MKLNELVGLRNELQKAMDLSVIQSELERNSANLRNLISVADPEYGQVLASIADQHSSIIEHARTDVVKVQETIDEINLDIVSMSSKFFAENYQTELQYSDPSSIRAIRNIKIPEGIDMLIKNRINMHSSWKYPALEIGCRDGEWSKFLVASDPLYVADVHQEFLDTTNSSFVPEYQSRLRKYLIQDFKIIGLPVSQFGFIFSFNFFNYLSLDSIKQYLSQALIWLRPGGSMLFTYNNADMPASAGLAESYFMTYVPKSLLIPMCESLGFEIVATQDFEPSTSWIEIKKAGTLTTTRLHQTLGRIKSI